MDSAAVHDDEGTVILTAGDSVLTVAAPRPWPSWVSQRTPDQLVAALRRARTEAFAGGPLPPSAEIDAPARPAVLFAGMGGDGGRRARAARLGARAESRFGGENVAGRKHGTRNVGPWT